MVRLVRAAAAGSLALVWSRLAAAGAPPAPPPLAAELAAHRPVRRLQRLLRTMVNGIMNVTAATRAPCALILLPAACAHEVCDAN